MSGIVTKWSPENVATLISCLRRNVNETTAMAEASLLLGFEVTFPAASKTINRHCNMRLSQLLGQDIKSQPPKHDPSTRPLDDLDPESLAELAAFRSTQAARASQLPPAFAKPEPKKERTSDDDLAEHRSKVRISELEDAKKRLLKDIADKNEQILILQELRRSKPLGPIVAVPKAGKNQQAAWDFVKTLTSPDVSGQAAITGGSGVNPYRKSHTANLQLWSKIFSPEEAKEYLGAQSDSINAKNVALDMRLPG